VAPLLLVVAPPGCRPREGQHRGPPEWQAPLDQPVDRTAPGELAEGKEVAFGLALPRPFAVERRFPDAVFARGTASVEQVASYLRARVTAKSVQAGPTKTLFVGAQPRAGGGDRLLRLEVSATGGGETELVVRDVTPPPVQEGLSEAQRWEKHGLTPDGKIIDPTKLE